MERPETGSCRRLGWGRAEQTSQATNPGVSGCSPAFMGSSLHVMRASTCMHVCAWMCDWTAGKGCGLCLCSWSLLMQLLCPIKHVVLRLEAL